MADVVVEFVGVSKRFKSGDVETPVLTNFSCRFYEGQVAFLFGPNGIGKTVFARCLAGLCPIDEGRVLIYGQECPGLDRRIAKRLGIEYIPQRLPRPSDFSVLEFLALGGGSHSSLVFKRRKITQALERVWSAFQLDIDVGIDCRVADLLPAQLQRLYIVKALMAGAKILVLDEPTAYLPGEEARRLGENLQRLSTAGLTIIVIAHPEQQVFGDDGIFLFTPKGITKTSLKDAMRFSPVSPQDRLWPSATGTIAILSKSGKKLVVRKGSVVCVEGPTTTEFFRFAEEWKRIPGRWVEVDPGNGLRISYIPVDATERCIAPHLDVVENYLIRHWTNPRWTKFGWFVSRRDAEFNLASPQMTELSVQPPRALSIKAQNLSGGNQQRLIVGRECYGKTDFLIGVNIFRGLDNDGMASVYNFLLRKSLEGMTTVLFSTVHGIERQMSDLVFRFQNGDIVNRQ